MDSDTWLLRFTNTRVSATGCNIIHGTNRLESLASGLSVTLVTCSCRAIREHKALFYSLAQTTCTAGSSMAGRAIGEERGLLPYCMAGSVQGRLGMGGQGQGVSRASTAGEESCAS